MSERGRRSQTGRTTAILLACLVAMGAQAQQTLVSTTDDSQGGFVVIEDAAPAAPPPKPITLPPPVASASSAAPHAAGSTDSAIPWVRRGPASTTRARQMAGNSASTSAASTAAFAAPSKPAATAQKPLKPQVPPAPQWTWKIKQGYSMQQQLVAMAKEAHWNVVWNYSDDIEAGSNYTSHRDFPTAAEKIIRILAANGASIHYHTFTGNNTFLVCGPQPCPATAPSSPEPGRASAESDEDGRAGAATP